MFKYFVLLVLYYSSIMVSIFGVLTYQKNHNPYFLLFSVILLGIHSLYYLSYFFPKFQIGDYVSFQLPGHDKLGKFATIEYKTRFMYVMKAQNGAYFTILIHKQFLWRRLDKEVPEYDLTFTPLLKNNTH